MPQSTDWTRMQEFEIALSVPERLVKLSGRLEKGEAVEGHIMAAADTMQRHAGRWIIDATMVHAAPGGVDAWIAVANDQLATCELFYPESQLAMILQFDDRYTHPHSVYEHQFR